MNKNSTLTFYGAAGTVTGSKYLLQVRGKQILLEAGLFQGLKEFRLRNWSKPPFDAARLSAVVLSHAHIDHSGYLPLLVRERFRGPVHCTSGTADLLSILLPDSAYLQEEEAAFANRHGYSKHKPALPLYTVDDAREALKLVESHRYDKLFNVTESVQGFFRRAGHILGAATVELQIGPKGGPVSKLVFSGDLGRENHPILFDPSYVQEADTLLIESTYGNREHAPNLLDRLAALLQDAVSRGGVLLIPAFAVGRTQEIIWMIRQLEEKKKIPVLPVYVDSPMAIDAGEIYVRHPEDHDASMTAHLQANDNVLMTHNFHLVRSPEGSKKINDVKGPAVVISASGMATGGRVLHHLAQRLPHPENTILLAGYQAVGTRGRALQDGAKKLRMFGQEIPVFAKIEVLEGASSHADQKDILRWLSGFKTPPRQTFVVHGEPASSEALAEVIRKKFGWHVRVPGYGEIAQLSS